MKTSFNISILGGRGYVGQEIIKIINNHPNFLYQIFTPKLHKGSWLMITLRQRVSPINY